MLFKRHQVLLLQEQTPSGKYCDMDITDGAAVIKAIVIFENYIRVFFII